MNYHSIYKPFTVCKPCCHTKMSSWKARTILSISRRDYYRARTYWSTTELTHVINQPMSQSLPKEAFQVTDLFAENFWSYTGLNASKGQEKGKITSSWAPRGWKGNADTAVGHFCENVWIAACSRPKDTKDIVDLPRAEAARYNTRGSATSSTCSCWTNNLVKTGRNTAD